MITRLEITLLVLTLFTVGCGGHQKGVTTAPSGEIALVVDNHHWSDVIVSVVHDGVAERVGLATAVKSSSFILQSRRLGQTGLIRLRGHAIGSPEDHTSDSFLVQPGQEILWTLEGDLARSSVAVR